MDYYLKPCPFCGSADVKYEFCSSQGFVECQTCGAAGPIVEKAADPHCDEEAGFQAWNQRVPINPETGEPYFQVTGAGWGSGWEAGKVLNVRIECSGAVPGTVVYGDWLDDGEGNMRSLHGRGNVVATVDYATLTITPVTDS